MADEPSFQVTLGEFSGPLDLLCHLVESSAIDASTLKLTDVLAQYVSYLLTSRKATLSELAEFFSLASRLLIRKVRSLLPRAQETYDEEAGEASTSSDEDDDSLDEETLNVMLERFRPYRSAAARLGVMKESRDRSYVRISDDAGPPWFDIGDLWGLATLWWNIIGEYSRLKESRTFDGFTNEIPDATPEEVLVEHRMEEVRISLGETGRTSLSRLLARFGPRDLIVTILALLELSRLGRLNIDQPQEWGDVEIETI
jgi:segregation and condensation protein A